jgi:undecaprenyl-diphosphatase
VLWFDRWAESLAAKGRGIPAVDATMYGASMLGDDGRVWIAAAIVRSRHQPDPLRHLGRQLAWLGIESALINGPAKRAVRRQRPLALIDHPHRLRRPGDSSFPSGHAASAATMAMVLSEDGLAPLWWTLALTIAASRVYVGVHHASDVAAGLAAGAAIGYAARHLRLPLIEPPRPAPAPAATPA